MIGTAIGILGLLVVVGATALWFQRARAVALPEDRSAFVAAWLGGPVLGASAFVLGTGWIGGVFATLAILSGGFLTTLVAISRQEVAQDAVRVGDTLPDFDATDEHDRPFALSSTRGHPTLLKFFRGHW